LSLRIIGQEEDVYKEYSQQYMTQMANEWKLIKRIKLKTFHFKFEYLAKVLKTMLFEDIHLYLLQLMHMKIITNKTTITQNFLVNMKTLKVIRIKCKTESKITNSGISHIINNCPEIQLICLNMTTELTNKSIDELIEIVLKRPHISFQFDLGSVERCYETIITKRYDCLPKNLELKYSYIQEYSENLMPFDTKI
jgi:hypothetical protein